MLLMWVLTINLQITHSGMPSLLQIWWLHFLPPPICWLRRGLVSIQGLLIYHIEGNIFGDFILLWDLTESDMRPIFYCRCLDTERVWSDRHFCPFKLFSIIGHMEVTSALEVTYPPSTIMCVEYKLNVISCRWCKGGNYLCILHMHAGAFSISLENERHKATYC